MPPCCWFLVFAGVWCLPLVLVAAKEQVESCLGSAKRCGNLTISDPFWLTNRKTGIPCGSSGFEVTCFQNSTPVLRSTVPIGRGFAIIDILYEEHSLRVVDLGKLELLEASSSCPVLMWNTSVKVRPPLRIDPVNLNLVFYNCTVATAAAAAHRDRELLQTTLKCGNKSNAFVHVGGHYNTTRIYAMEGCHATIVPVLGSSSGKANASNYGQLISNGFLLTWQQPSVSGKLTHQTVFHIIKLIYE